MTTAGKRLHAACGALPNDEGGEGNVLWRRRERSLEAKAASAGPRPGPLSASRRPARLPWLAAALLGGVLSASGMFVQEQEKAHNGAFGTALSQGREFDSHAGHYFFRNRVYFPEWGAFATPDMNMGRGPTGEAMGMGSCGSFGNDPLGMMDPLGLAETFVGQIIERATGIRYIEDAFRGLATAARWVGRAVPVLAKPMEAYAFWQDFSANAASCLNTAEQLESLSITTADRIEISKQVYRQTEGAAVADALNLLALDLNPMGQIIQGTYGMSLEPANPQEQMAWDERATRVAGGVGGTAVLAAGGLSALGPRLAARATESADIVFRRVSQAERSTFGLEGLKPTGPSSTTSPTRHILGAKPSPSISATRDYEVALGNYGRGGTPIIEIDLSKVAAPYTDFSVSRNLRSLTSPRAVYNATRDAEVLIHGPVPPEAIGRIHYP